MPFHKRPASRKESKETAPKLEKSVPKKSKLEEVLEEEDDIVCLDDAVEKGEEGKEKEEVVKVVPEEGNSTISDDNEEAPELEREEAMVEERIEEVEDAVTVAEMTDEEFRRKEKAELLELFGKCEQLGGPHFEANHERVLIELDKQKDTIKSLLDEIKVWKAQQKVYNMGTIFKRTSISKTATTSKKAKTKH